MNAQEMYLGGQSLIFSLLKLYDLDREANMRQPRHFWIASPIFDPRSRFEEVTGCWRRSSTTALFEARWHHQSH
jgi:hypothetical protein